MSLSLSMTSRAAFVTVVVLYVFFSATALLFALHGRWSDAWEAMAGPGLLALGFILGRVRA